MAVPLYREPTPAGTTAFWNIRDIQTQCRISRSTAWRLVREDGFPAPVLLGRAVLWPSAEVLDFLELHRRPDHYRTRATSSAADPAVPLPFVARPVTRKARRRPAAP